MAGEIHLRLHGPYIISQATKAKKGGKRPRVFWRSKTLWRGRPWVRNQRMKSVRVAVVACDGGLARFDETARPGQAIFTCGKCAVLNDAWLESGIKKPLTSRRLALFIAKQGKQQPAVDATETEFTQGNKRISASDWFIDRGDR